MTTVASPAAVAAYQAATGAPAAPTKPEGESGFAALLEEAAKGAVDTLNASEQTTIKAAAGEADLLEVVSSVHDAEATLRTVVAVRDKVVASYQEILRMPV